MFTEKQIIGLACVAAFFFLIWIDGIITDRKNKPYERYKDKSKEDRKK
jgi:hypothetical protein